MDNVIDIDEAGADVDALTTTEGTGLLGRSLLRDEPLVARLERDERPRFVLRNKKRGVTVERPAKTETVEPVGRYSGLALVSNARVLFVVGGRDGDQAIAVSLPDVVDVRVDDGGRSDALVLQTADDARYEFPCRGDLRPVREYLDAAVGVWTRSTRRVERAEARLDELGEAFEAGDVDAVLDAIDEVKANLDAARAEADALESAREHVDERGAAVESDLAALERRAYAERAEQARERAQKRWDDHEYEAAFDCFDDAAAAYEAAAAVDADQPSDDLLMRRYERLEDERARLAAAPVDRASHAADVATAADEPGAAIEWWETAVERYETALSLDWGRDDRRFEGDRGDLQASLATAARSLVDAYCEQARALVDEADDAADSDGERIALDRARRALAGARDVARERVPDATERVARVETQLNDRDVDRPSGGGSAGAEVDGGRASTRQTVVVPSDEADDAVADSSAKGDGGDANGVPVAGPDGAPGSRDVTAERDVGSGGRDADDTDEAPEAGRPDVASNGTVTGCDGADGDVTDGDESVDGVSVDGPDASDPPVVDPAALDAERFASLVSTVFERAGWTTTRMGSDANRPYDLRAELDDPVGVAVCVWTVPADADEPVDGARVERCAAYVDRVADGAAAAVCTGAPVPTSVQERAREYDVDLLDPNDLAERAAAHGVASDEY